MRKNKKLALVVASLFLATLWGCGSNMDSGGDQTGPETVTAQRQGSNTCVICHSAIAPQWAGSVHDDITNPNIIAGCEGCHGGGQFHKGIGEIPSRDPGVQQCATCHETSSPGFLTRHLGDDSATSYATTPSMPTVEGYVFKDCLECHTIKDNNSATIQWEHNPGPTDIQKQWAQSAHAGRIGTATPDTATVWGHYDWDQTSSRGSCQRCHTATGAMNFLSAPATYNSANNDFSHLSGWTATNKQSNQNELLYCRGCHSDISTGALRNPGAITEVYAGSPTGSPTATVIYPDAFKSNVCMGCHLGREVGEVIKVSTGDFTNLSFINSHYLAAGGMIFGKAGYEYAGQDYTKTFEGHASAGSTDGNGPCVTCHMTSAEPHKFEVVTKDASGAITAVATTSCGSCHGNMNVVWLEERKETYHEALDALRQALLAKGIQFIPNYPYFYVAGTTTPFKNWNAVYPGSGKDVMGAAFNYNLLEHDPGAYTHNRSYALKLIADSIDFLADGIVDGAGTFTINAVSVNLLATAQAVEGTTLDAKHFDGAVLLKAQYVAPVTSFDTNGGECSDCHAGGDTAANGAIIDQFAESAHGEVNGDAWKHYDWRASNRAACARCHNATAYVAKLGNETNTTWLYQAGDAGKAGEVLSCAACHTDVTTGAVRTPGAYTETYNDGATYAFPNVAASNLCVRCHSARESGGSIIFSSANFANTGFINSHYLSAGGTVFATTGYPFGDRDYSIPASDTHVMIGRGTTGNAVVDTNYLNGPCVSCHFDSNNGSHTLSPVTEYAPGDVALNPVCVNCHTTRGAGTNAAVTWLGTDEIAATLQGTTHKARYQAALEALKVMLDAKGLYFYPANPYFFTAPYNQNYTETGACTDNLPVRNWNVGGSTNFVWNGTNCTTLATVNVTGDANTGKLNMGAAFNYNLLLHDPGGVAHNRRYTRRLIYDAIDWIDNGVLDYSVSTTLNALDGATAVYKTSAISYLLKAQNGDAGDRH